MKRFKAFCILLSLLLLLTGCGKTKVPKSVLDTQKSNVIKTLSTAKKPTVFATEIEAYASKDERISAMEKIATDENTDLYFDEKTGDIAIKKNGEVYLSTPYDLASDNKSTNEQKQTVASQISISYMDKKMSVNEMSSFKECIAKGQYTTQKIENGIAVNMVIGRDEKRALLPPALLAESFETVIENLSGRDVIRLKAFYKLYDPDESPANQIEIIKEKYPIVESQAIYVLKNVTDKEKEEIKNYFKKAGYGFTAMDKDLDAIGVKDEQTVSPRFEITVYYFLKNGELNVSIPSSKISYDKDNFSLLDITVLGYFGAKNRNQNGYIFAPDGSGAIFGFNSDGTKSGNEIAISVYEHDRALNYNSGYDNIMPVSLPVFGIVSDNGCLMGIISSGESHAKITVSTGGNVTDYARSGVTFSFTDYDTFEYKDVNTQYSWKLAAKQSFKGNFEISYIPLGSGSGYSDMASYYKNRLNLDDNKELSPALVLGLLGSTRHQEQFLFVPVNKQVAMTSYKDAEIIADDFSSENFNNLSFRYIGWQNGGLDSGASLSANSEGAVGSKRALKKLASKLQEKNIGLYMDIDPVFVKSNSIFDRFNASRDTARKLDKTFAGYNHTMLSSGLMDPDDFKYALRPSVMYKFYNSFTKSYDKLSLKGISLGTIGNYLNSDKDEKKGVTRAEAASYSTEILNDASKKYSVMTEGCNAYTLPYIGTALAISSTDSGYPDADTFVPFLQMVLHGKVSYTTKALNLSGNYHTELLKAIETGSGLYFELAYKNSDVLKSGKFADYYTVDYSTWKDKIKECYDTLNKAVGDLVSEEIVSFEAITDKVSKVTYSTGDEIYVNYGSDDYIADGITVKAESYLRNGGK